MVIITATIILIIFLDISLPPVVITFYHKIDNVILNFIKEKTPLLEVSYVLYNLFS